MSSSLLNDWQTLLANHSISSDNKIQPESVDSLQLIDLGPLAIISVCGEDAKTFLQGQITCDVENLNSHCARYGAYANIKGRVQSGFIIFSHAECFHLLLPADNAESTTTVLKKYAMFSKVSIANNPEGLLAIGLVGELPDAFSNVPCLDMPDSYRKILLLDKSNKGFFQEDRFSRSKDRVGIAAYQLWQYLDICQGLVSINKSLSEEFTIQGINYDLIGAVDFDKGCYLGQEVIARSHYRGKTKQRAARFSSKSPLNAGNTVVDDNDKTVGKILVSVELSDATYECIANIRLDKLSGTLTSQGSLLNQVELPYSLDTD